MSRQSGMWTVRSAANKDTDTRQSRAESLGCFIDDNDEIRIFSKKINKKLPTLLGLLNLLQHNLDVCTKSATAFDGRRLLFELSRYEGSKQRNIRITLLFALSRYKRSKQPWHLIMFWSFCNQGSFFFFLSLCVIIRRSTDRVKEHWLVRSWTLNEMYHDATVLLSYQVNPSYFCLVV